MNDIQQRDLLIKRRKQVAQNVLLCINKYIKIRKWANIKATLFLHNIFEIKLADKLLKIHFLF